MHGNHGPIFVLQKGGQAEEIALVLAITAGTQQGNVVAVGRWQHTAAGQQHLLQGGVTYEVKKRGVRYGATDEHLVTRCDGNVYRGIGAAINIAEFVGDFARNVFGGAAIGLDQAHERHGKVAVRPHDKQGHVVLFGRLLCVSHNPQGVATLNAHHRRWQLRQLIDVLVARFDDVVFRQVHACRCTAGAQGCHEQDADYQSGHSCFPCDDRHYSVPVSSKHADFLFECAGQIPLVVAQLVANQLQCAA